MNVFRRNMKFKCNSFYGFNFCWIVQWFGSRFSFKVSYWIVQWPGMQGTEILVHITDSKQTSCVRASCDDAHIIL